MTAPAVTNGRRVLLWSGLAAAAGLGLAACEYPSVSRVEPNPVAYVRPAPTPPFADGGGGRSGLVPYVAVTIPPPQPPEPLHPLSTPLKPALPPDPSWWDRLVFGATVGAAKAADGMGALGGAVADQADKLTKPVPAPVVTVPVYTAPVYGPAGSRSGY